MWMLTFLPDDWLVWVAHAVTALGALGLVAGFFLSAIPIISNYGRVIRPLAALMLMVGIYFEGSVTTELAWRKAVADMQAKVAESEAKAAQKNVEIQTKIVNKIKVVKEKEIVIQEKIKEVEKIIDANCTVPNEALQILNEASDMPGEGK
jgi:hypothetical protein